MRINKIIFAIFAFLLLTSCNKWLNITPKGDVEGKDLLTNEKGYNAALNGIYYSLTANPLYGEELTYGMMDVLAQYWDLGVKTKNPYYKQSKYDFEDADAVNRFNEVWTKMYECIGQINYILEALEGNRSEIKYSELIEGECYALRAFIHMELAAMYGPVIKNNSDLDKKCISYRTEYDVVAKEFESTRSVLTKAKEDLLKAEKLLENDPIVVNQRYGDGNSSLMDYHAVLERRGARMNLFAVKGLMMRLELAMLNKTVANKIAVDLISSFKESNLFYLVEFTGAQSLYDLNLGQEMLLSFYKNDLWESTLEAFGMEVGNQTSNLCITNAQYTIFLNDVYGRQPDGAGTDSRLRGWFKKSLKGDFYDIKKFTESPDPGTIRLPYYPEIAIIRLAEVYYVACETFIGVNNTEAMKYLNEVRDARNLPKLDGDYDDGEVWEYLMREMRKDFVGEGRMFPTYKRLFKDFYVKQGVIISATDDKFVFPIPDLEYEYSPNEAPSKK